MYHAVNPFLKLHKGTVGGHIANLTANLLSDDVALFDLVPWVGLELADTKGNLLIRLVDSKNDGLDVLPEGEDVGGTNDPLGP